MRNHKNKRNLYILLPIQLHSPKSDLSASLNQIPTALQFISLVVTSKLLKISINEQKLSDNPPVSFLSLQFPCEQFHRHDALEKYWSVSF